MKAMVWSKYALVLLSGGCLGLLRFLTAGTVWRRWKRKRAVNRTPFEVAQLLGMSSHEERNYVRRYAADAYTGAGAIVDLGCWLGSFTVPLAMGLRENPLIGDRASLIHAYDHFRWEDWMDRCAANTRLEGKYKQGDSFVDAFTHQVAPIAQLLEIHCGNLNEARWEPTEAIEYLLIDAMKSWELSNSIVGTFFPALRSGVSLVHHQDFVHYYTPWIHLIMYRLRRYFEPLIYVPEGSYIFKYREQIPRVLLEKRYDFSDFSDQESEDAFEYSLSLVPETARANVLAAKVMMRIHRQEWAAAYEELERVRAAGIPLEKELATVSKMLEKSA